MLAKALTGRNMLHKLLARTETEPADPEPVFLDFGDVDVATASFLRECVLGYRDAMRHRRSNLYAIVSNPNDAVEEELGDLLRERGDAMLVCSVKDGERISALRLIGGLDPKHRQTFERVVQLGGTDAATLIREHGGDETVTRTAWNNRLSALADLGLVIEESHGRAKRYLPVLREG
ncbi:MAG: hypothetical protein WBQ75_10945 [Acetobacteraceae bacterium]